MLPAMRAYSGAPAGNTEVVAFTQTDTLALSGDEGGATGAEFANSRLMNFLSDDAAPRDRDLDSMMHRDQTSLYSETQGPVTQESPSRAELPPLPPSPDAPDPVALPPLENLVTSRLQQQETELADNALYRGSSAGSLAQELYTNTRDVLSRLAA